MDNSLRPGVYRAKYLVRHFQATYREIEAAADQGFITRLRHGWYATEGADPRIVAAVRAGGIASCVTALDLVHVWVPPHFGDEVHVRKSKHGETVGIRRCHAFGPVPPTAAALDTLPAALASAARCMTEEQWIAAVDNALNKRMITIADLEQAWGQTPEWVRSMLTKCDPRSQSGTETLVRLRLRALNFRVQVQPNIPTVGRVDLLLGRLIIECDSEAHHSQRTDRRNDYRRDRKSLIGRWPVLRVDYWDIIDCWPEILADIRDITATDLHRRRRGA
ncbi:hypothetical protein [Gordonia sp. CPCC 205333]|uniref:hypothetical protein n=1 Tax=Gordonia sp. CPCC 205333 TaxID=3140790 RepID=UPI003AF3E065